jgi:TolB-like protein/Flp pilus assembly protein TadD
MQIRDALQAAGVEVWFDQSELVGGDAWDAKIRAQIKSCALFVPVISANTQARLEGYFRIEWRLAAQRTLAMAEARPFLLPIVIDGIPDAEAHVPEEFRAVQWTRPTGAAELAEFARRARQLLAIAGSAPPFALGSRAPFQGEPRVTTRTLQVEKNISFSPARLGLGAAVIGALALGAFLLWRSGSPTTASPSSAGGETPVPAAPVTAATPAAAPPETAPPKSIVVLPFANLGDKENEYFSDGISEDLLNLLARVPGLRVAARTSSFYFKDKQVPVAEIARQLGVAYVLEGSVRRAGERVRITAQLVKAADGFPVWSDAFDRALKDIFAVQDEIAGLIAQNLRLEIGLPAPARGAVNDAAYQLYLQGRQAWNLRTAAGLERAEQCFERALALDAKFARAYLGRADVWSIRGMERQDIVEFGQRNSAAQAGIVAEIDRALALEPDLAEAHASLGNIHWLSWRFADAERELRRALTLDPNYATAHLWLGRVLQADGRLDEALLAIKNAVDLDPLSSRMLDNYANALLLAGRLPEGLAAAERAAALQPDNIQALARQATALADLGRNDEAVAVARRLLAAVPMRVVEAGYALAKCGLTAEAEQAYARLLEINARGIVKAYVLAALGRWDDCLQALEPDALQASIVDYLYYWPVFDPIRADPRFLRVIAAVGADTAYARAQAERAAWQRSKGARQ